MIILGRVIITLAKTLHYILSIYNFIVLIAVFMSWFRPDPYNPFVRLINQMTEPVFRAVRRRLPEALFRTGLDFTPIIIFILLMILDELLVGSLFDIGYKLRMGYPTGP